jgi:DNA mismatch endonuclease (patch repair protein)
MADVFSKAKRSHVMSRIRSHGNKDTELVLARLLRVNKITGWRRQLPIQTSKFGILNFKVRPDFVFRQVRLALFVDGCFWHACPKHATQPEGNRAFWEKKLNGNQTRDRLVNRALRRANWRVLRIWEHELKHQPRLIRRILRALR